MTVEVLSDRSTLVERALDLTREKINSAIAQRGQCSLALAGGGTPKPLYQALAGQNLPWDKLHIFWGDERYVPADDPDSNQKMAREAWLNHVSIPAENIHPMPTDRGDPQKDAQQHEQHLREFFQCGPNDIPRFDLIFLGMGDDGHTASLFPKTEALEVRDCLVTVGNKDNCQRLTFTIPLINQARCVIFLVSGENKRPALAQVFAQQADETQYPARLINPQGELWWLLDQAAGMNFSRT